MSLSEKESSKGELTPRQREIVRQRALGYSQENIAYQLGISVKTVQAHCQQVYDKLNIHNLPDLTRYAVCQKIVSPEEE